MQQAAITFIVCQMSSKKEQEELYTTFKAMDKNGDGTITKEELIEGYRTIFPQLDDEAINQEAAKVFDAADTDGSGTIDYSEWGVATVNKR